MSILVVGSIVLDFVAVADRLPRLNETVVTMEALSLASAAGALACLGLGVQSSLPNRDQIFEYSQTINSGMRLGAELAV